MAGGSVVDELVVVGTSVVLVVDARVVLVVVDVVVVGARVVVDVVVVDARVVLVVVDVVVVDARVVLVVVDVVVVGGRVVLVVVVGGRVVLVVDEVVEAPTSVTLITFDGPLNDGAAPAWLSATMAMVSVVVCPGAGSPTVNVSMQGVAAHTTEAA